MLRSANIRIQDMIFFSEEDFNNKYKDGNNEKLEETKSESKDINDKIKKDETEKTTKEVEETRKNIIDKHNDILDSLLDFAMNDISLSNDVLCIFSSKFFHF